MGKKKANTQPVYVTELLEKGTTVITATSREALADIINHLAIPCRYAAGAVGKNRDTGIFSLRLDKIND